MKELTIQVKYQQGDLLYTIKQAKEEIECHICEGTKTIKFNNKDMKCPECMGKGVIIPTKTIYMVCKEPFIISKTKIDIENNGQINVKYKGRCGFSNINRAEENIFTSKEEAQRICDELNKERVYIDINDIIVPESFKESRPCIDKIQTRLDYYNKHGKFDKYITIDKNNTLQDGYITYLICKMLNLNTIRVIVENN